MAKKPAKKPARKRGRPRIELTPEQVKQATAMAAVGVTHEQIAAVFGISSDTLVDRIGPELEAARVKANTNVATSLYVQATEEGNTTAMIFWLKCRAGWKENIEITHDRNVNISVTYNSAPPPQAENTPEQFRAIERELDEGLH